MLREPFFNTPPIAAARLIPQCYGNWGGEPAKLILFHCPLLSQNDQAAPYTRPVMFVWIHVQTSQRIDGRCDEGRAPTRTAIFTAVPEPTNGRMIMYPYNADDTTAPKARRYVPDQSVPFQVAIVGSSLFQQRLRVLAPQTKDNPLTKGYWTDELPTRTSLEPSTSSLLDVDAVDNCGSTTSNRIRRERGSG
jgi:hypothetical protein